MKHNAKTAPRTIRACSKSMVRFVCAAWSWVPLTPLGLAVILLSILLLIFGLLSFGFDRQDKVLQAVTVGALALLGLMPTSVILAVLVLWLRKDRPEEKPLTLEAGVAEQTGYRVRLLGWLPLVKVEWSWEQPAGVQVRIVSRWGSLREQVTASERAARPSIVRRFVVTDLFGLARFWFRKRQIRELTICPHRGNLQQLQLAPQYDLGDDQSHPLGSPHGDLLEMRAYAPGDPLKQILWKVYARTGRLLVRTPERAVKPCERTMAYLVAGHADEAAAGIARKVLEAGMLGADFLFGADGEESPTPSIDEAVRQIVRSANARRESASGLDKFLALGKVQGIQACSLFVPAEAGAWLDRVAGVIAGHRGPFRVLIGVDGVHQGAKRGLVKTMLLWKKPAPGSKPAEVRKIALALQKAGAVVNVVDRETGTVLHQQAAGEFLQAIGA